MELVFLLLIIVVLLITAFISILSTGSRTNTILDNQKNIRRELDALRRKTDNLFQKMTPHSLPEPTKPESTEKEVEVETISAVDMQIEEELLSSVESIEQATVPADQPTDLPAEALAKTIKSHPYEFSVPIVEPVKEAIQPEPKPIAPKEPGKVAKVMNEIKEWIIVGDKYRAEGVSKEYAIATNWLARIGIIIAVLGIGFGLRYSYQHGWIAPAVRVAITALTGVAMSFFGLKLEGKKYELLGHGLLGGGITTLYFSVFSATHFYNLISPTTGMVVMALITAACGIISAKFDSKLVSILGIIGGYATPVMMSTGVGNLPILYTYMLLIGIGVLGITTVKNWYLVQFLAFVCHWSLFVASLGKYYHTGLFPQAMAFLSVFFVLFSFNACVYHLAKRITATVIEVIMLILNSTVFTIIGYGLIEDYVTDNRLCAILTISLAVLYIVCSHIILSRRHKDKGLILTFIGLSAFYTTISLPILLDAGWLTISWSLQALLMLWLSRKLNSRFLQSLSYVLYCITFISLINTLGSLYSPYHQRRYTSLPTALYFKEVLRHLMQVGIPTFSFFMARKVLSNKYKESSLALDDSNDISAGLVPQNSIINTTMQVLFVTFVFIFFMIETNNFFHIFYIPFKTPAMTAVIVGLLVYLFQQSKKKESDTLTTLIVVVTLILCGKVLFIDVFQTWQLQDNFIYRSGYIFRASLMRLLNFSMLTAVAIALLRLFRRQDQNSGLITLSGAISLIVPFIFLTLETNTFLNHFQPGFRSGGISIIWSLYAIGLLATGIRGQNKLLRYCSLGLFSVVILKVFMHDLADLDELWRILAFIVLGCIIFLGSFLYIRFQHLFTLTDQEEVK